MQTSLQQIIEAAEKANHQAFEEAEGKADFNFLNNCATAYNHQQLIKKLKELKK